MSTTIDDVDDAFTHLRPRHYCDNERKSSSSRFCSADSSAIEVAPNLPPICSDNNSAHQSSTMAARFRRKCGSVNVRVAKQCCTDANQLQPPRCDFISIHQISATVQSCCCVLRSRNLSHPVRECHESNDSCDCVDAESRCRSSPSSFTMTKTNRNSSFFARNTNALFCYSLTTMLLLLFRQFSRKTHPKFSNRRFTAASFRFTTNVCMLLMLNFTSITTNSRYGLLFPRNLALAQCKFKTKLTRKQIHKFMRINARRRAPSLYRNRMFYAIFNGIVVADEQKSNVNFDSKTSMRKLTRCSFTYIMHINSCSIVVPIQFK